MVVSHCKGQIDHDSPWLTSHIYECSLEKLVDMFQVTVTSRNRFTGSKFKTFAFCFSSTARVYLIKNHVSHLPVWTCTGRGRGYKSITSSISKHIAHRAPEAEQACLLGLWLKLKLHILLYSRGGTLLPYVLGFFSKARRDRNGCFVGASVCSGDWDTMEQNERAMVISFAEQSEVWKSPILLEDADKIEWISFLNRDFPSQCVERFPSRNLKAHICFFLFLFFPPFLKLCLFASPLQCLT